MDPFLPLILLKFVVIQKILLKTYPCLNIKHITNYTMCYYYNTNGTFWAHFIQLFSIYLWPGECTSGSVRLVGGGSNSEGRVQVCVNGVWGSVSTTTWGANETRVVCNQLGFISEREWQYIHYWCWNINIYRHTSPG